MIKASTWGQRLSQEAFKRVAKPSPCGQLYTVTDAEGQYGSSNLLRPSKIRAATLTEKYLKRENGAGTSGEMRLVQKERNSQMWNEAAREHGQFEGRCENPNFSIRKEIKKGLCWKQALQCSN